MNKFCILRGSVVTFLNKFTVTVTVCFIPRQCK